MNIIIIGKNIDVTPGLREAVEEKIGKLEKYFTPDTEVHVTLSVEKDRQKIEVTIPVKGSIIDWAAEYCFAWHQAFSNLVFFIQMQSENRVFLLHSILFLSPYSGFSLAKKQNYLYGFALRLQRQVFIFYA